MTDVDNCHKFKTKVPKYLEVATTSCKFCLIYISSGCSYMEYSCHFQNGCLDFAKLCNGVKDCIYGDDEDEDLCRGVNEGIKCNYVEVYKVRDRN